MCSLLGFFSSKALLMRVHSIADVKIITCLKSGWCSAVLNNTIAGTEGTCCACCIYKELTVTPALSHCLMIFWTSAVRIIFSVLFTRLLLQVFVMKCGSE